MVNISLVTVPNIRDNSIKIANLMEMEYSTTLVVKFVIQEVGKIILFMVLEFSIMKILLIMNQQISKILILLIKIIGIITKVNLIMIENRVLEHYT